MAYIKSMPEKAREISVAEAFVTEYMPEANGNFVKVYLLGLNQCMLDKPMTKSEMADRLQILESDVIRAWNYWADKKVVKFDGENVEFLDLNAKNNIQVLDTKPVYYPEEISACMAANAELSDMFRIVEKILSKPFSSTDLVVVYSLYDYYRIPLDVIPMLVTFCMNNGKKSMKQIEATAAKWVEKGIDSVETAENYLKKAEEYNKAIEKLKNALGVTQRKFSPTEIKYINGWLYDMKVPFEKIMKAYDVCASNTGKLSVKYMDTVLKNQLADVGTDNSDKSKKSNAVPTKFTNFDQRTFDYDAFEKRTGNK